MGVNEKSGLPQRRSNRLQGYDYSLAGAYFVTVVTYQWEMLFGNVVAQEMRLTKYGEIVQSCWLSLPSHFPHVNLDEFAIMPNHIHGIIFLREGDVRARHASPVRTAAGFVPGSLGATVASFKSAATKRINKERGTPGARLWLRNYHDRVIRNQEELENIREYIVANPLRWAEDEENPAVHKT